MWKFNYELRGILFLIEASLYDGHPVVKEEHVVITLLGKTTGDLLEQFKTVQAHNVKKEESP